uniref:RING-type domain-containing protein n=1 Tax=Panagrolaimus sp. PS1159 TaxID=55785 RepID=A0AC35F4B5_9BILA
MSCLQNGGFFNDPRKSFPRSTAIKKIDKLDDHKLKELARCCICFENYSLNTRAPICAPCGHCFCAVCIRKLIHGNLVCCCICRKVTFFSSKELGKNIQLLDIIEQLGLLDPDERVDTQYTNSSNFPENIIEAVEDKDLVKFFDFCFTFVKKFYENKQENLVTNLAMVNPEGHQGTLQQHANEMFFARSRLGDSFDKALARFNECLQTMNSHSIDRDAQILNYDYGGVDDYIPFMEDNDNDPFGLESATIHGLISLGPSHEVNFLRGVEENERESPSIMDDTNVAFLFYPINEYDAGIDNDNFPFNEEYVDPPFQPGAWNPVSKLFTQSYGF